MRSRSSSKHNNRSMEVERPKLKEETQLSGAYIRSLVKHLSSRPKEPATPKSSDEVLGDGFSRDPAKFSEVKQQHSPQKPQQPKKQVRRRLHTSRPYQERLLNMAEARREIVTALKHHRASMKQASEQHQHQQPNPRPLPPLPPLPPQPSPPALEKPHQELMDSMTNPRNYQPNSFDNYFQSSPFLPFTYPWVYPPIAPLPISDNVNLPLPNQPLGLNLNFQGFNNIETPFYNNRDSMQAIQTLSSPSSSSISYSYSSPLTASTREVLPISDAPPRASEIASDPPGVMLHPAMDDEAMAEIRSIGQQHDMEWNDKMNLVTSAWWSQFLNTMEPGSEGREGDEFPVFDEVLPQYFDDYHMEDYLEDASLPCLDIGEIEGFDGDWLS